MLLNGCIQNYLLICGFMPLGAGANFPPVPRIFGRLLVIPAILSAATSAPLLKLLLGDAYGPGFPVAMA
jgi:hypothetical protein